MEIWNRTEERSERLADFYVVASDTPFASNNLTTVLTQHGVTSYYFSGHVNEKAEIAFERSARYIRIHLAGKNYLSLAEVNVFGN